MLRHRFEYAIEAAAVLAGVASTRYCSRVVFINPFWDGLLGRDKELSDSHLAAMLDAPSPTALLDKKRLAALWLPHGDADMPGLLPYMRRMRALLHMVPEQELLGAAPEDGWLQEVFCSLADSPHPLSCTQATHIGLAGRWHSSASRSFAAVGYSAQAGCRGDQGRKEFHEGDVFQTLASLQYLPRVDGFVDVTLDDLGPESKTPASKCKHIVDERSWPAQPKSAAGGRAYVLMGARWHRLGRSKGPGSGWPPPDHVTPVFVGFRVEQQVAGSRVMQSWFNKWGPVGARDEDTAQRLEKDHVAAVNGGCLTLGLRTWVCPGSGHVLPASSALGGHAGHASHPGAAALASASARRPTALVFGNLRGVCNSTSAHPATLAAGVQAACGLRHKWVARNMTADASFTAFDLGARYDLQSRAGQFQLAVNKLRAIRGAALVVTNSYFHVVMPAVGLGVPALFVDGPGTKAGDTRFKGLEQLFTTVEYKAPDAANAQTIEEAVLAARAMRLDAEVDRCAADGMLAGDHGGDTGSSQPGAAGRAWRDELYRRQLRLLSRHAPLLDAINRLGTVDALMDDVQAADEAWVRGELPRLLQPSEV
ncbi:hypothetical protein PLESTF_001035600 [Pleodorina starrii]|nr:hypothetical protein PLESTF_001035600 [Pleodorina starrii]